MNHIHAFNQNKAIQKDLDDIDSLKDFFNDIIDSRYTFWLTKKNELVERNKYLTDNLNESIKFKNRVNKYNPEKKDVYIETIDKNINYVNQCLVKVTDLLKMVNNKLLKNKNSITAIVLNYIKENKLKARNESLKLYDTIKFDEQRNREISSVLTKYHNKIIEPGINMIINFI